MNVKARKEFFMKYVFCFFGILVLFLGIILLVNDSNANEIKDNTSKDSSSYKDITPKDAKKMLDANENVILLDVRTPAEYQEKHIPNSTLLPLSELEDKATSVIEDIDINIVIYCRSGNRSVSASLILVDLGYKNVYNLGGIIDWPYETETGK
jgi:phage shock protein E